jgi:glycosyltransferase involved in cell wall biosynthesis
MSSSVSVVMAIHNGARFLRPQLASVLRQLEGDDEFIVIDDRSTDDSALLVSGCDSARVRLHANERRLGVVRSFERGLCLARRDLVFLCDQDDVWLPGKRTAVTAAFAADPGVSLVVSDAEVIDGTGARLSGSFMSDRGGFNGGVLATLWRNRFLGCAMAMRRSFLALALPIPAGVAMHDMWFGALAAALGRVAYLPTPLMQYRRHVDNATPMRSRAPAWQMLRWRARLGAAIIDRTVAVWSGRHRPPRECEWPIES